MCYPPQGVTNGRTEGHDEHHICPAYEAGGYNKLEIKESI